jgi:phosphoribosyl 1,2-cyclic phosphodiesterase
MSLFVSSLNSGSNGNCYYIGNQDEAILIDGGISCRETVKRLKRAGLSIKNVKAIFVSHEHGDHIHGVPVLCKKFKLPVYITSSTLKFGNIDVQQDLVHSFRAYEPIQIGKLTITAFPKHHDASDPHSFIVSSETVTVGVFTDIGMVCDHVIDNFKECHACFLESNYDEDMLENGRYPISLKRRISGGKGHLSNTQALKLFIDHRPAFMSHLFLSHLSADNNRPKLVHQLFSEKAEKTEIIVAPRTKETRVYHIRNTIPKAKPKGRFVGFQSQFQLPLFQ